MGTMREHSAIEHPHIDSCLVQGLFAKPLLVISQRHYSLTPHSSLMDGFVTQLVIYHMDKGKLILTKGGNLNAPEGECRQEHRR